MVTLSHSWRDLPARAGTYAIILQLEKRFRIRIGRLDRFEFPRGWYIYVGSARGAGGLRARVRHHWHTSPRPHWHIDFLRRAARPVYIVWQIGVEHRECDWAQALDANPQARIIAAKFGASDCNCGSHLFYLAQRPDPRSFDLV